MITITVPEWLVWFVVFWAGLEVVHVIMRMIVIWLNWQLRKLSGDVPPLKELLFGRWKR